MQDLAIIGIHTDPDKAEAEINALVTVHNDIKSRWKMGKIDKLAAYHRSIYVIYIQKPCYVVQCSAITEHRIEADAYIF